MCGRYTLTDPGQLPLRFDVEVNADTLLPRYNIAPSQLVPVVVERPEGRALQPMRWGFQPAWAAPAPNRPAPINARAETLLERPLFRGAVVRRRCLIVADGFYEWQGTGRGPKQPVYIRLRSGGLFAFAGLYTDAGEGPATCAIITTDPNDAIRPIHNRMPAILEPAQEAVWIDPLLSDPSAVLACLRPFPPEELIAFPVSRLVSDVRNDGPRLIEPLTLAR
jgi:putative SOS response-associated peptidase YedK